MYTHKTVRLFLASLLLATTSFSSLAISPAQADTSSTVTLSPVVIAKLDAFLVKVQALRSKYSSDADWSMFIDKLSGKIIALKPRYIENPLILAVLNRLNSGVVGLKNTTASASLADNVDLCTQEGLDNIDETNFSAEKHVDDTSPILRDKPWDTRWYKYKMGPGQSYSFPFTLTGEKLSMVMNNNNGIFTIVGNPYGLLGSKYRSVISISDRKCDFPKSSRLITRPEIGVYIKVDKNFMDSKYPRPAWYHYYIIPEKKYYYNIRWLRKSDISASEMPILGNAQFNSLGDACLETSTIGPDNIARRDCSLLPFFQHDTEFFGLPVIAPNKKAQIDTLKAESDKKASETSDIATLAFREKQRLEQATFDALPSCGSDWQKIGSFGCDWNRDLQTITSCKPPENGYGHGGWFGSPGSLIWKLYTGKSCSATWTTSGSSSTTTTPPACVNKAGGPLNKYGDAWCSTQTKPDGTKFTRSINDCLGYCE